MTVDLLNPLSPEDLAHIEEGIQQTELVIQGVEKASRAGVDVGDLSAQAEETLKKLLQLKNVYFPNQ